MRFSRSSVCVLVCRGAVLAAFAFLAWSASRSKSPTYDEPLHTAAAQQEFWYHDFRVDPEDPPLWKMLAAFPNVPNKIAPEGGIFWPDLPEKPWLKWVWCNDLLYATEINADVMITRARAMMLALAVLLGVVIARWGWELAGAPARSWRQRCSRFDPNLSRIRRW